MGLNDKVERELAELLKKKSESSSLGFAKGILYAALGNLSDTMKNRIQRRFPNFNPKEATEDSYGLNFIFYSIAGGTAGSALEINLEGGSVAGAVGGFTGLFVGILLYYLESKIRGDLDKKPVWTGNYGANLIPNGKNTGSLVGTLVSKPIDYAWTAYDFLRRRNS